jgi:hypothetical protein
MLRLMGDMLIQPSIVCRMLVTMVRKALKPEQQGHIDGMCAVCSVLNACKLLFDHSEKLDAQLFKALCEGTRNLFPKIVYDGKWHQPSQSNSMSPNLKYKRNRCLWPFGRLSDKNVHVKHFWYDCFNRRTDLSGREYSRKRRRPFGLLLALVD